MKINRISWNSLGEENLRRTDYKTGVNKVKKRIHTSQMISASNKFNQEKARGAPG